MSVQEQPPVQLATNVAAARVIDQVDLVGGPFAVIESDPGVFTSLTRKLGIRGLEVVEIYDIQPWAVDHLNPQGLIFCFLWHKDNHRPADFDDPAAERVWFANQVIDDACASQAILNVVLNCPDVDLGEDLGVFREETEKMSPVMKGLAMSNSLFVRQAHNSLARPADIRGAVNAISIATLDEANARKLKGGKPPPAKRRKVSEKAGASKPIQQATRKSETENTQNEESYHFIGYVPAYGKVWELDGLKSGPLEVGELPSASPGNHDTEGWMDIVRPALRIKMQKYGGAAGGDNIRFSLLALVNDQYQAASDEIELLKREKHALEKRLNEGRAGEWESKVDPVLLAGASEAFATSAQPAVFGPAFAQGFGSRRLARELTILHMPEHNLVDAWEECIKAAIPAKVVVEDEINKSIRANTDYIKRTHDYEPFICEFITCLHAEGFLNALLDRNAKKRLG